MKGWKTFGINLAIGLVGLAVAALQDAPIESEWVGGVVAALAAVNVGLRAITSTPIFRNTPE
jgi:hypothetical protein